MNVNTIQSYVKSQLNPLKQDYNKAIRQDQSVKEINMKIKNAIEEGFTHIEKYLAANPVTKQDLEALQRFRDELVEVDQITERIGLEKLSAVIERILLNGTGKAYFNLKPTLKDKIGFLLDEFKNFFVDGIRSKINKQIFFTWNQKLRFNASLEKLVKLNEEIPKLEASMAEKGGNAKFKNQLDHKKAELTRTEKFVAEYEKNLALAERTRQQFETIGGTRLAL